MTGSARNASTSIGGEEKSARLVFPVRFDLFITHTYRLSPSFSDAEGNSDSVSAALQAERIALLSSVFTQQAHITLPPPNQAYVSQPMVPRPFPSMPPPPSTSPNQRLTFAPYGTPSTSMRANLAVNSQMANQAFVRRTMSTPDVPSISGNIVYQTPTSPSTASPPIYSDEKAEAIYAGQLLPSFLKDEVKPTCVRTPTSLSPSSTSSADLSFDEYEDDLPSPSSFIDSATMFYAQQNAGSGALSSSASGSSSSLTLGGSIWALDRDEDKVWSSNALPNPDLVVGSRLRTTSIEASKPTSTSV